MMSVISATFLIVLECLASVPFPYKLFLVQLSPDRNQAAFFSYRLLRFP